jgi:hypothetical protein
MAGVSGHCQSDVSRDNRLTETCHRSRRASSSNSTLCWSLVNGLTLSQRLISQERRLPHHNLRRGFCVRDVRLGAAAPVFGVHN